MNWVLDRFTEQNPFASAQKGRFHHPFQGGLLSSAALPGAQLLLLWIHPWLSHCHPQTSALIVCSPGLQFFISPTAPLLKERQPTLSPAFHACSHLQQQLYPDYRPSWLWTNPPSHCIHCLLQKATKMTSTHPLQSRHFSPPIWPHYSYGQLILSFQVCFLFPYVLCIQRDVQCEDIHYPHPSTHNMKLWNALSIPTAIPDWLRSPWEFSTLWKLFIIKVKKKKKKSKVS